MGRAFIAVRVAAFVVGVLVSAFACSRTASAEGGGLASVAEAILADAPSRDLYLAIAGTGSVVEVLREEPWTVPGVVLPANMAVGASTTSYCDGSGVCRRFVVRFPARMDLRSPFGVNSLRHELAHALAFARAGLHSHDDLGHPRPETFYEAWRISGDRHQSDQPSGWYCWAAYHPYVPHIDAVTGLVVMPGPEQGTAEHLRARREWTSCEVARTGRFR